MSRRQRPHRFGHRSRYHPGSPKARACQAAYLSAPPLIRRLLNQVFFKKLLIEDDSLVSCELAPPFDTLLSDELQRAVRTEQTRRATAIAGEPADDSTATRLLEAGRKALRAPEALSVKELKLVAGAGFEPATSGL